MNANMYNNRRSFDRFGDDLCEHILSYLSLTNCFRYEYVSKQWKRLIFNKQNKLEIRKSLNSRFSLNNMIRVSIRNEYLINWSRLQCVLQKCRFITELNFSDANLTNADIDIITNNCQHLKSFKCYFKVMSNKSLVLFATKFGQTLENLKIRCDEYLFKMLIHLMPNLRKVCFVPLGKHELNIKSLFVDCGSKPVLPKLEEIVLSELFYLKGFESFADTYCKQIKKFKVCLEYKTLSGLEKPLMNQFLTQLKRFDNLEKLDLDFNGCDLDLIDKKRFRLFGRKCAKLSELRINGYNSDISNCFDNNFVSLRNLSLNVMPFDGGVESIKHCTQLTHLSLYIDNLTDDSIARIDTHLTQLKDLSIYCNNTDLTDTTLRCLAKLRHLKYLRIDKSHDFFDVNENITDSGVCDVINNCSSIEYIEVFVKTKVSKKSLNAFCKKAKQFPKIQFYFCLRFNTNTRMFVNDVPNNMNFQIIT